MRENMVVRTPMTTEIPGLKGCCFCGGGGGYVGGGVSVVVSACLIRMRMMRNK